MPKIALFQDYLAQYGGAERVTEAIPQALPESDLHTTLLVPEKMSPYLRKLDTKTTWMQHLPAKSKLYRHYFLFYPFAVESAELDQYDLVVSSCCGYAKGVRRGRNAIHICYCHNPMRWVWRFEEYMAKEKLSAPIKLMLHTMVRGLKQWEMKAAHRPDYFVANSHTVARRLKSAFGIEAAVIEPPIETSRFWISKTVDDYYLILSRLIAYKRIDLAVEACTRTGRRLMVIGSGPDREMLDFGMAPLEVNAAGRPVVAYGAGGATETIREQVNGILFREQSTESLIEALEQFERQHWDPKSIRKVAMRYDIHLFQERFLDFLCRVSPSMREYQMLQRRAG